MLRLELLSLVETLSLGNSGIKLPFAIAAIAAKFAITTPNRCKRDKNRLVTTATIKTFATF
jgi:hypothetical protein